MGDLGDFYRDCNEAVKQRREQRRQRYEPMLEEIGAKYKAPGIWEYGEWFCYPSKGYAMLRTNNRIRKPLRFLIQGAKNGNNTKRV